MIGVDGVTFNIIDTMIAKGTCLLLRLAAPRQPGVLRSERPVNSPALWTTIATGQPRETHRIFDFVTARDTGEDLRHTPEKLVTSDMRQSPTAGTGPLKQNDVVSW
ncbi:MAG: alkaline phosphatase family protein [Myxococcota bacterium]